MKKGRIKSVLLVTMMVVLMAVYVLPVSMTVAAETAAENGETGLLNIENPILLEAGNDEGVSRIFRFTYNGKSDFSKEEADDMVANFEINNDTKGIYDLKLYCYNPQNTDYYWIGIEATIISAVAGSEGSFTIRYKDYEQTYHVKVIDYSTTIKDIGYSPVNADYCISFEKEADGTAVIDADLGVDYVEYLKFINYYEGTAKEVIKGLDYSTMYIDDLVNLDSVAEHEKNGDSLTWMYDEKSIGAIELDNDTRGSEFPELTILPKHAGEAWFTLHYGEFEQRFHVVIGNGLNLPSRIYLDRKEIQVKTGESFQVQATTDPSDAYYKECIWMAETDELASGYLENYMVKKDLLNDQIAEYTFYEPGVYRIWCTMTYDYSVSSVYYNAYYSEPCTVTVTGEKLDIPDKVRQPYLLLNPKKTESGNGEGWKIETLQAIFYPNMVGKEVTDPTVEVWCETDGKEDLTEYTLYYGDDTFYHSGEISLDWHHEAGIYHAYAYGIVNGERTLLATAKYLVSESNLKFDPNTPRPPKPPVMTYYCGDANLDGSVTADDSLRVLQHIVKLKPLSEPALTVSRIGNDNVLDATDALEILQVVVKLKAYTTITIQ